MFSEKNTTAAPPHAHFPGGIVAVANRHLVDEPGAAPDRFIAQIDRICLARPAAVVLREKDLSEDDYAALASRVLEVCRARGVRFVAHTFAGAAADLGIRQIHLPLPVLRELAGADPVPGAVSLSYFDEIGSSVHSVDEAREAVRLGCTRLAAGHIFSTDCKPGLAPRGLGFLRSVCEAVPVPVYAIGGIDGSPGQLEKVLDCGAAGACMMSGAMRL